jgi:hypothetical protein
MLAHVDITYSCHLPNPIEMSSAKQGLYNLEQVMSHFDCHILQSHTRPLKCAHKMVW